MVAKKRNEVIEATKEEISMKLNKEADKQLN